MFKHHKSLSGIWLIKLLTSGWAVTCDKLAATCLAGLIAFSAIPEPFLPADAIRFRETLKRMGPNRADYESNERGYYEALLETNRSLGGLAPMPQEPTQEVMQKHIADINSRPIKDTNDIREYVLLPSVSTFAYSTQWETNSLGLRDREYPKTKPINTIRIAVLGDSITCGWGVRLEERFEDIWEENLNRIFETDGKTVEVWNFAAPGYSPGQRWKHFEIVGDGLDFDLVVYQATTSDPGWDARRMSHFLTKGIGADDPLYAETLKSAGFIAAASGTENRDALLPWSWTIVQGVYRRIVQECHDRKLPVAFVLIPKVGANLSKTEIRALLGKARSSGFDHVVDLSGLYDKMDAAKLAIAPGDYHPNSDGHKILAKAWETELAKWPALMNHIKTRGTAP
jgi:hypothetical protein